MGMQYALWLSGRTRSKDEISRIVGRGRRVVGGSAFGSEPPRLTRIEHAKMRKTLALFLGRVSKKDPRGARILGQRQRLLRGQERRRRLRDAADGDCRKEGQDEIDVVLRPDHNAVALLEAAFDQPAGELANHQIEVAIGPRTKRARPVAEDQRRLGAALGRLPAEAMLGQVEGVRRGAGHNGIALVCLAGRRCMTGSNAQP